VIFGVRNSVRLSQLLVVTIRKWSINPIQTLSIVSHTRDKITLHNWNTERNISYLLIQNSSSTVGTFRGLDSEHCPYFGMFPANVSWQFNFTNPCCNFALYVSFLECSVVDSENEQIKCNWMIPSLHTLPFDHTNVAPKYAVLATAITYIHDILWRSRYVFQFGRR
jgi:hypothetical protein